MSLRTSLVVCSTATPGKVIYRAAYSRAIRIPIRVRDEAGGYARCSTLLIVRLEQLIELLAFQRMVIFVAIECFADAIQEQRRLQQRQQTKPLRLRQTVIQRAS